MGPTGPVPATQISQPHLADPVNTAYTEDIIPDYSEATTQNCTLPATIIQPGQANQTFDKARKIRGTSPLYFCCF